MQIPIIDYQKHSLYSNIKVSFFFSIYQTWKFLNHYFKIRSGLSEGNKLSQKYKNFFKANNASKVLDEYGIHSLKPNDDILRELNEKFKNEIFDLKQKRELFSPETRGVSKSISMLCNIKKKDETYYFFNNLCKDLGILEAAQAHKRMPLQLCFVALQINNSEDGGIIKACKDETGIISETKYMHIDSGVNTMKCILYLNKGIKKGRGSFSYVLRSHKHLSTHVLASRKANDVSNLETLRKRSVKRKFSGLPRIFRHKANFGNDLIDYHHRLESSILLENEVYMESDNCLGFIFNPDGIHRGAIFSEDGERVILQIMLVPKFVRRRIRIFGNFKVLKTLSALKSKIIKKK